MSHVSIELAKQLKKAGLIWEPKPKDNFAYKYGNQTSWLYEYYPAVCHYPERFIWLPRLDQLLTEIKKRGYQYVMWSSGEIAIAPKGECTCYECHAESQEDAATMALLWILNRQKEIAHKEGASR